MSEWKKVGEISVDAGVVWLGDPCYILHRNTPHRQPPKDIGANWARFVESYFHRSYCGCVSFKHDLGHEGLGVVVSSGNGDGVYDVEVKQVDGRIAAVRIVFIDDE